MEKPVVLVILGAEPKRGLKRRLLDETAPRLLAPA